MGIRQNDHLRKEKKPLDMLSGRAHTVEIKGGEMGGTV